MLKVFTPKPESAILKPVRVSEELHEVRLLLRQQHLAARRVAVGMISNLENHAFAGLEVHELNASASLAVLDAAVERYPLVLNDASRPAEMLARLLWRQPRLLSADAVAQAAMHADQHARWALLQLLVLRHDNEGVQALESLLAVDGIAEVMSPPVSPVFDPLLQYSAMAEHDHPLDLSALVRVFAGLLKQPGWTSPLAAFLQQLQQHGRLQATDRSLVIAQASAVTSALLDTCNASAAAGGRPLVEPSHVAHQKLRSVASLLVSFDCPQAHQPLYAMLGSADPLVSVIGVVALSDCGMLVGSDRIEMLARDPQACAALFRGLDALDLAVRIPEHYRTPQQLAKGDLMNWLSQASELGQVPDEIESLGAWLLIRDQDDSESGAQTHDEVELFRFRMNAPHWSCQRGWMLGSAGAWTHSCYSAEDEFSIKEHIQNLQLAVGEWQAG